MKVGLILISDLQLMNPLSTKFDAGKDQRCSEQGPGDGAKRIESLREV